MLQSPSICPNPVFIVGAPRSGTTVLGIALAQHPQFFASDESFILFSLYGEGQLEAEHGRWSSRPSSSWLRREGVTRDEFLAAAGLGFNALFTSRSGARRWVDHTPHYGLMAETLAGMFPGAMFLHIVRDGRQVVNSMINVSRTMHPPEREKMLKGNFLPRWALDFEHACRTWKSHVQAVSRFCGAHPDRCLTVIHGELERDPAATMRRVIEFLGAPHSDAPAQYLASHRINSSFGSPSDPSRGAPRRPDPWESWTAAQKQAFIADAGSTLAELGFASAEELKLNDYERMVLDVRVAVAAEIPRDADVSVATNGDAQWLDLPCKRARHFPSDASGEVHNGNPAESADALSQLERARADGSRFLIIPASMRWWLDHYREFAEHLEHHCRAIRRGPECWIYDLELIPAPVGSNTVAHSSGGVSMETDVSPGPDQAVSPRAS